MSFSFTITSLIASIIVPIVIIAYIAAVGFAAISESGMSISGIISSFQAWLESIMELQREISFELNKAFIGKTVKVLVESVSRDSSEELLGQTEQHEKVAFKADKKIIGSFVKVHLVSLNGNTFKGEIVE